VELESKAIRERNKVKRFVAVGLLLVSSQALAIECGPIVRAVTINQLQESVKEVGRILLSHRETLLEETKGLGGSLSDFRDNQVAIANAQREMGNLASASDSAQTVWGQLDTALQLAHIRDRMANVEDKQLVSAYLSHRLWRTFMLAEHANKSINLSLANISRPGFAVDIAKLRDVVAVVLKHLANCTPPPQGAERK
jgi:hypothetical protein